jgi:DNA-binding transcriptional MerR regulator
MDHSASARPSLASSMSDLDLDTDMLAGDALFHDVDDDVKSRLAFRTISEVATEIDVPQHVLRFWESKFSQIRPLKRGGGRRYYRPEDIELLRRIKNYLYKQGYTIKGVQRLLKEKREAAKAAAPSFVPYAHPQSHVPPMPHLPILSSADYLHAAAIAPSAMAMAYGVASGNMQASGRSFAEAPLRANPAAGQFADAFEESTVQIDAREMELAKSQLEKSLNVVTQIHDEIATPVTPIRMVNPMAADIIQAFANDVEPLAIEPVVEELAVEALAQIIVPMNKIDVEIVNVILCL